MNTTWVNLSKEEKTEVLSKISDSKHLSERNIEKDWWVTFRGFDYSTDIYLPSKINIIF